jgi:hypothetical protein
MRRLSILALPLCLALLACGNSSPSPGAQLPDAEPSDAGEQVDGQLTPDDVAQQDVVSEPEAAPAPPRIVAIGDLHGSLDDTRATLKLAGAIDDKDAWIGKDLVVVQTGDEIDRADYDREVLDLFETLRKTGSVFPLLGNHEIMNAEGDFSTATAGSMAAFDDVGGRTAAFAPGGAYAKILGKRKVIEIIDGNVFVHGGVLPAHVTYGIDKLNGEVSQWLDSGGKEPSLLLSSAGPTWTRLYSDNPDAQACAILGSALNAMHAKRMIVGHTVQDGGIVSACNEKVWLIDSGMIFGGPRQVLEIKGDTVTILN